MKPPSQRELIRLFIPLALSGVFFPLARPIINAALARSGSPELSLAAFAVALSVTMPIISPLFSLRQVATALSTDKDMLGRIRRLTLLLGSISTLFLLTLSIPGIYDLVVVQTMAIPLEVAQVAAPVLLILALTPLLSVGRGYYQGILVHYKKAGPIGTGALIYVLGIALTLVTGMTLFSVEGAILAAIASVLGQLLYVIVVAIPSFALIQSQIPERSESVPDGHRNNRHLFFFYVPLAVSSILSAFIEPALQTGIARSPAPTASLAAFAIAASLGWLARTPLWNAQQIVISQASNLQSYIQTKKFMLRLGIVSISLVSLLGAPLISDFVFTSLMGVTGDVKHLSISGFRWMLPLICLQALRSLYHGVLIRQNLTQQIQYASMLKIPTIIGLLSIGVWYGQIQGLYLAIWASLLAETLEVYWLYRATKKIQWPLTKIH